MVKGSQYTSLALDKRCREMGMLVSTGSAGDCYDNAVAESFFATLACELINPRCFPERRAGGKGIPSGATLSIGFR